MAFRLGQETRCKFAANSSSIALKVPFGKRFAFFANGTLSVLLDEFARNLLKVTDESLTRDETSRHTSHKILPKRSLRFLSQTYESSFRGELCVISR